MWYHHPRNLSLHFDSGVCKTSRTTGSTSTFGGVHGGDKTRLELERSYECWRCHHTTTCGCILFGYWNSATALSVRLVSLNSICPPKPYTIQSTTTTHSLSYQPMCSDGRMELRYLPHQSTTHGRLCYDVINRRNFKHHDGSFSYHSGRRTWQRSKQQFYYERIFYTALPRKRTPKRNSNFG